MKSEDGKGRFEAFNIDTCTIKRKATSSEMRNRLTEVLKEHKEMNNLASSHWQKAFNLETEKRHLLWQIIKEEKLLSDGIFSFRIDRYLQDRSCVLEGPYIREMKRLEQLLNADREWGEWGHFSIDLEKGTLLSVHDREIHISIHKLKDVQKVIDDWNLKVEFKNLEEHKAKLEEDLKVINTFIKKVKGGKK